MHRWPCTASSLLFRPRPFFLRLLGFFLFAHLLTGCASNAIRGEFNYDLRPQDKRSEVVWPQPPEKPRYRYVGELVGQQNFTHNAKTGDKFTSAMKWIVGLFDTEETLTLERPQHGLIDDKGRVYIVDAGRSALVVFDPYPPSDGKSNEDGGQLLVWNGPQNGMRFGAPVAVALVWNGDLVVSDAKLGMVIRLNSKGEHIANIGAGQLRRPTGLAFDSERGLLFVADTVANDVKVYDDSGQLVNTIGSPGDGVSHLNAPTFMTFSDSLLYVTDTFNSRIQIFDADGNLIRSFGERGLYVGNLARPKGVAVGSAGIVYVVESYYGHMLAFNQRAELLLGINGSGIEGDRFFLPSGVWTDSKGKVFLADMFNGRVVVFQFLGNQHE